MLILDYLAILWIRFRARQIVGDIAPSAAKNHPVVSLIANEMINYVQESNAVNGVTSLLQRQDGKSVVIDVRWANGKTPHERLLAHSMECTAFQQSGVKDKSKSAEFLFNYKLKQSIDNSVKTYENKGGLRKIAEPSAEERCISPQHDPPMHIVLSPGTYEYICPSCGHSVTFHVPLVTM